MTRRLLIISFSTAFIFACGGLDLFPRTDIEDVSLQEARDAGFRVMDGASHISIRQRSVMDIQVTWSRIELDEAAETELRSTLTEFTWGVHPAIPGDWPTFQEFQTEDFVQPTWWTPTEGAPVAFTENRASDQPGDSIGTGRYLILDGSRIYEWSWSSQWWGIEP